jgi:DNA polymerase
MVLPAGRALAYAAPKVVLRPMPWDKTDMRPSVAFWGVDSYTRQWKQHYLYGGLIVENAVQAAARDLLADAMQRTNDRGFPVILSVHDEIVAQSPDPKAYDVVYEEMTRVPAWAEGCPVTAEGWSGDRYRK